MGCSPSPEGSNRISEDAVKARFNMMIRESACLLLLSAAARLKVLFFVCEEGL